MDKTKAVIQLFDHFAETYQEKYGDQTSYAVTFDRFCAALPTDAATVLELGCGPGNVTQYLLDRQPTLKITALDLAPEMLRLARQKLPQVDFREMDARDIGSLSTSFDGILAGFCLPYLSRPEAEQLIHDAKTLLRPGGILYLSTMEGAYSASGWKGPSTGEDFKLFTYYHEADSLKAALQKVGFVLLDEQRIPQPKPSEASTEDLILLAQIPSL